MTIWKSDLWINKTQILSSCFLCEYNCMAEPLRLKKCLKKKLDDNYSFRRSKHKLINNVWQWTPTRAHISVGQHWCHKFKSWTRLIAFHIALILLGKVWIQLFPLQRTYLALTGLSGIRVRWGIKVNGRFEADRPPALVGPLSGGRAATLTPLSPMYIPRPCCLV